MGTDRLISVTIGLFSEFQEIEVLCKQRSEDEPPHSWQGCEDRHVALLCCLTRLGLLGEAFGQVVEPGVGLAELAVDEGEPLGDGRDVGGNGLGRAGGHDNCRGAPAVEQLGRVEAADALALK